MAIDYQSLALAGVAQCAALVHALANGRPVDTAARQATLAAVTTHHARDLADVFPTPADFQLGMQTSIQSLSAQDIVPEVARYTLQLLDLAQRLAGNKAMSARLGQLLDALTDTASGADALADVYQQTISKLGKRIQVTGEPRLLRQENVANDIRAQLLAGVRFAWLWRQLGGRRWHLILRRRALLVALQSLRSQVWHPHG
jgi:high frequency lysogenization protein